MPPDDQLQELRRRTTRYLTLPEGMGSLDRLQHYIDELLPFELDYAKARARLPSDARCGVLVMLVGYALEPLLQSICVYKPREVFLVLNDWYGDRRGNGWGEDFIEILRVLQSKPWSGVSLQVTPDPLQTVPGRPADVFRYLRKQLLPRLRDQGRVVLDITGAKKSMVAGAYLFGAYANVPVSYVDFDDYDATRSRPWGYSCRIGLLENPYAAFALREWQDVERLYRHYAFTAARERLGEVKGAMGRILESGDESLFAPAERAAVDRLHRILRVYELWDNGDFPTAYDEADALVLEVRNFAPPSAVSALAGLWRSGNGDVFKGTPQELIGQIQRLELGEAGDLSKSFYVNGSAILTYAHDELAKVRRLIAPKEDYRSGLLRAAGLHDALLKARVMILWHRNELVVELTPLKRRSDFDEVARTTLDRSLAEFAGIPGMVKALRWAPTAKKRDHRLELKKLKAAEFEAAGGVAMLRRDDGATQLADFWKDIDITLDDLATIRNKAIHAFLAVPRPIAGRAAEMAAANLADFESHWAPLITDKLLVCPDTEALPWERVCNLCGIDFLPPSIEQKESQ